jgi:hypothetical protein
MAQQHAVGYLFLLHLYCQHLCYGGRSGAALEWALTVLSTGFMYRANIWDGDKWGAGKATD